MFTMAVSTIYLPVSTVDGEAFIISHCHALQHKSICSFEAVMFVIAGWHLQDVSASPVPRVDCILTYLQL